MIARLPDKGKQVLRLVLPPYWGHVPFCRGLNNPDLRAWKHSFKTPTVRNAALTAPYMHNGAFTSLEEVVDFYDAGGGAGLGLDIPNQTLPNSPLNLTEQDKKDLIAFMESLTDTASFSSAPERLPQFPKKTGLHDRPIGGRY